LARFERLRSILTGGLLTASVLLASPALAQPADAPAEPPPPTEPAPPPADEAPKAPPAERAPPAQSTSPNAASPKRTVPDYDGRGEPDTSAGDVALWIPRVIFAPLYFVSEYVIRRPLGWFITTAERNQWPSAIRDFFTFGPEKKAGVVPTAFLDFGFRASVGIYAFWDDLFAPGNHLRLHATTLGKDWLQGAIADRIPLGKDASMDLRVEGLHRPDFVFHGIGPRTLQGDRTRFGSDQLRARPVFEMNWWRSSRVSIEAGAKYVAFRDDACCDDPSLSTAIRNGTMPSPPGYSSNYTSVYQRGELTIDSREERPASQSGVRLELEVEHGSNVRKPNSNWIRWGGTVGGIVDIKNSRTVSLSLTTLFADPISREDGEIPFTEQVVLGGSGPMRGYLYGRMTGRSAAIATLKYKWPIWAFLDGTMQVATGNVFGPQLEDLKTKLLRLSAAMGVESVGSPDHTFEFLAGFGTETFDQGATVNSFRLLFGTNRGF
jgi:hypothetical protein